MASDLETVRFESFVVAPFLDSALYIASGRENSGKKSSDMNPVSPDNTGRTVQVSARNTHTYFLPAMAKLAWDSHSP